MNRLAISSLAGLALLGACRGNDSRPDDALKNDLALAAQVQPYQAQQWIVLRLGARRRGAARDRRARTTRPPLQSAER